MGLWDRIRGKKKPKTVESTTVHMKIPRSKPRRPKRPRHMHHTKKGPGRTHMDGPGHEGHITKINGVEKIRYPRKVRIKHVRNP